ncbi:MAG: M48 family metallopeptidase [Bradymonadia bacterium]
MTRRAFPDLDARGIIHPHDAKAQKTLQALPGFKALGRWASDRSPEAQVRAQVQSRSITGDDYDRLEALYREAVRILDVQQVPDLFYVNHPSVNAAAVGWQNPFIVVTTGTAELPDEALMMILGHELTHIICDHMRFKFTAIHLRTVGWAAFLASPLVGGLSVAGLSAGLAMWDRRSELTADRGGLLTAQSFAAPRTLFERLERQMPSTDELPPGLSQLVQVMNTHPDLPDRMKALDEWVGSGIYERMVSGDYPRRSLEGRSADDAEYGAHLDALAEIALLEREVDRGPSAAELEAIAMKELEDF